MNLDLFLRVKAVCISVWRYMRAAFCSGGVMSGYFFPGGFMSRVFSVVISWWGYVRVFLLVLCLFTGRDIGLINCKIITLKTYHMLLICLISILYVTLTFDFFF